MLNLNHEFIANDAKKYDQIIIATGFRELFLGVPGAVLKSVVSIFDILHKKIEFSDKKNIVIYARSELSLKLALYMAKENRLKNVN